MPPSLAVNLIALLLFASPAQEAAPVLHIDRAPSYVLAVTGKTGLFSFAAHEHAVLATEWSADVNNEPARRSVEVTIAVRALVIDSAEGVHLAHLGSAPSASDVAKIQQRMLGPEVLDAQRFPTIQFRSTAVEERPGGYELRGQFALHGQTHEVVIPVRFTGTTLGDAGAYDGTFTIRQTWFGMKPETVGGGAVRVKDEIQIRFHIVAR